MLSFPHHRLLRSLFGGSLAAVTALVGFAAPSPAMAGSAGPLGADRPAHTAVAPDAVRAWASAIEHDAGRITITGTAYSGEEVTLSGPGVTTVSTHADFNGVFSERAQVDGFGPHEITVTTATGAVTVVRVTTQPDPHGGLFIGRGAHDATFTSFGAWRAWASIELLVDGRVIGETSADGSGKWAYRTDGIAYGRHVLEARSVYDGAVQSEVRQIQEFTADTVAEGVEVDLRGQRIIVSGTGQDDTRVSFSSDGAPIETLSGEQSVAVEGGRWSAELPLPVGDARFFAIDVTASVESVVVGSAQARATIPLPFTTAVDSYRPKKLVLSGTGEVNATVTFTDADGAPIVDADGQPVTASIGAGVWTRTLDPRRFDGGTVTVTATVDGQYVGESTVTFR